MTNNPESELLSALLALDHAPMSTHNSRDGSCTECPWPLHELPPDDMAARLAEQGFVRQWEVTTVEEIEALPDDAILCTPPINGTRKTGPAITMAAMIRWMQSPERLSQHEWEGYFPVRVLFIPPPPHVRGEDIMGEVFCSCGKAKWGDPGHGGVA